MFQVTAIQFGTDQLQGASSEQLSMFIFWYFNMELLPRMGLQWVLYLLSYFMINIAQFQLGCSLFCMLLLSVMLCMKSCFMYNWFSGELKKTTLCTCTTGSGTLNPYALVYRTLRFALTHNHPVQRSALTYWEDKIPSRIDLGKSKYGTSRSSISE